MKRWIIKAVLAGLAWTSGSALAFSVFELDATHSLKWGDNLNGTPGGVVTWSFIPAGTAGSGYCGTACPGVAVDSINMEISPGGGFTSVSLTSLESYITAAMNTWAAAANISFVKVGSDSGAAINDPGAVPPATGQIRIGVFSFDSGGGAVGYAPPPNGGTGAGDVIFDANSYYQNYPFAPDAEGTAYDTTYAPNDFQSLLLHELGHAIGLAHPAADQFNGSCPVMEANAACFGKINRALDADDIAGARFLYGAAPVPEPETWALMLAGLALAGCAARRRL
jgi:hypothetical protein